MINTWLVEQIVSYKPVAKELQDTLERLQNSGHKILNIIETKVNKCPDTSDQGFIVIYETKDNEEMRDATPEERKSVSEYINKISRDTGANFYDELDKSKPIEESDIYQKGMNDIWECVKKIALPIEEGGMNIIAIGQIFDVNEYLDVIRYFSPTEVISNIKEYEKDLENLHKEKCPICEHFDSGINERTDAHYCTYQCSTIDCDGFKAKENCDNCVNSNICPEFTREIVHKNGCKSYRSI